MSRLLAVALWGMSFVVVGAVAAGLATASISLGSGTASVVHCDPDGVSLTYQLDASEELISVTLSDVDPSCGGGIARVTLTDGSAVIGSGTTSIPSSGFSGSVVVPLGSSVNPADVQVTAAAIDGV